MKKTDFGTMRHCITFLKPSKTVTNGIGEDVPLWVPYHPVKGTQATAAVSIGYDRDGGAVLYDINGDEVSAPAAFSEYAVWASVKPVRASETDERLSHVGAYAALQSADINYSIICRYMAQIYADMKIYFRGRLLDITGVVDTDERYDRMRITAKEVRADEFGDR